MEDPTWTIFSGFHQYVLLILNLVARVEQNNNTTQFVTIVIAQSAWKRFIF